MPVKPLELPQPYLIFLGEETEATWAKTAFGLRDWVPELCVAELALPKATVHHSQDDVLHATASGCLFGENLTGSVWPREPHWSSARR